MDGAEKGTHVECWIGGGWHIITLLCTIWDNLWTDTDLLLMINVVFFLWFPVMHKGKQTDKKFHGGYVNASVS